MSIQNMHYDLKQKLNKIDSAKYRNLLIPEIDWKLNEAFRIFIKFIAEPRIANQYGFETSQRTINDIRTLVVDNKEVGLSDFDPKSQVAILPSDYWFLLSSLGVGQKGECIDTLDTNEVQHDDKHEQSVFNQSSFEWREVNFRYIKEGLRFYNDGTFKLNKVYLDYIQIPPYIHYAQGFQNGTYKLPDGTTLSGMQNSGLPHDVEREIVDIAVLVITGDLQIPDYQVKMAKVKLND